MRNGRKSTPQTFNRTLSQPGFSCSRCSTNTSHYLAFAQRGTDRAFGAGAHELAALRAGALLNSNEPQVGVALDAATAARFTRSPDFLLLIDRGPLAMRYTGDSEAVFNVYDGEILDFCALVRSEADQFMGMPPHPTTEVLAGVTNADVLAEILKQARSFDSHQVRLDSGEPALAVLLNSQHSFGTPENALAIVCEVLGALVAGYAVLITDPTAGFTPAEIAPILASERAVDTRRQGK